MRVVIFGTGAVGGYYGVRLAQAGHDVHFVARGAQAEAISRSGLFVRSELGDDRVFPAQVTTDAATIGHADLVIVAVKLWDTDTAGRAIVPIIGASTIVLSLQNGIDKDAILAHTVGHEHVLGGVTYILVDQSEPGTIVHSGRLQRIVTGEIGGGRSDRVDNIVTLFLEAGIDAVASDDIRAELWQKFAFLASISAVTAATRQTIGVLRADAVLRTLLHDAMQEVMAVARAEGVELAEDFVEQRMSFVDTLPADGRASMAHDLLRGGRLELEWLSGAVVQHGKRAGIATPIHRTLMAVLTPFKNGTA